MSIKAVEITGYKCFSRKQVIDLSVPQDGIAGSGLNVLIGENNSGKTAVLSAFTKLHQNAQFFDEEKYDGRDIFIKFVHSEGGEQIIKNILGSANLDQSVQNSEFLIKYQDIHYIKDNRIWTSNFSKYNTTPQAYRTNADLRRHDIDSDLANALSSLEKEEPALKLDFNNSIKKIIPSFSDWYMGAHSKTGSYITYEMLNGKREDIDYSLGSGILNLFRIVYALIDDSKIVIIDEPEAYLHPQAQQKLAKLLIEKSREKQIIIATHSPFMFQEAVSRNSNLIVFRRTKKKITVQSANTESWGLFEKISPTHSEINYKAYGLVTSEFHNELYGFVQSKFNKENSIKAFDLFLVTRGDLKKVWKYGSTTYAGVTTYIRNYIHHPEQKDKNPKYSQTELRRSISFLVRLMKE